MKVTWLSESEEETRAVGAELARELAPDGVLLLRGELGSGKTVLTQGLATGLGIDYREVQSPSFILMREHQGPRGSLLHIDLYRLDPLEVEGLGLWEALAGPGVKVVEWSERLPFAVPGAMELAIRVADAPHRRELVRIDRPARDNAARHSRRSH